MEWVEISVQADGEAAEAVSELFNRLNSRPDGQGGAVIEVGGFDPVGDDHRPFVVVKTYLPVGEPESLDRQRQIEEGLWHLGCIYPLGEIAAHALAEEDWANAWKAGYHPLRVGQRFWIVPAWERDNVRPAADELLIVLDPGMAFGTGLHPSTQLCLCLMEKVVRPGQRVLDAGCGSGILSIAAARLGAARVDAFDIDPIAVRATQENAALNDLPIPINVAISGQPGEGPLWTLPDGTQPMWDVIVVNILPHVITSLLDAGLSAYLAPRGRMILAGIIEEREPDVHEALTRHGLAVTARLKQDDWVGLIAQADELTDLPSSCTVSLSIPTP
ncbi:MAG: 50S ribosomal protein L11 methyltransferase [Anaerolineae bacterium]